MIVITTIEFGEYVAETLDKATKKFVDSLLEYKSEWDENCKIESITYNGFYLHESEIEKVEMRAEDELLEKHAESNDEYDGNIRSSQEAYNTAIYG